MEGFRELAIRLQGLWVGALVQGLVISLEF